MKKMIFLLLSVLCLSCQAQKNKLASKKNVAKKTSTKVQKMEKTYHFNEGEKQFLKEWDINVSFLSVTEDSQCPKDAKCIWSGVAVAEIEVMGIYTRPRKIYLSTINDTQKGYSKSAEFNDLKITLNQLNPYPSTSQNTNSLKGNYQLAIEIEKTR